MRDRDRDQDPVRLRHELGTALEHALLSAGVSSVSSEQTRAKTLAALGLAGSATLLAGAAAASSFGSAAKVGVAGWAKLVLGVSAISAATAVPVGYYYVQQKQQKEATAAVHAAPRSVSARAPIAASSATAPAIEAPVAAPVTRTRSTVTPRGELTQELAALDRVRGALAGGDARGALTALDTYDRGHPNGRLELEAEVLRIEALAKSGRTEVARDRAEAFLRRHPQSVLAARVRAQLRASE